MNCLSDDNRGVRKRALGRLCKEVATSRGDPQLFPELIKFLLKPVLKMFSDPVENCRAVSIEFLTE